MRFERARLQPRRKLHKINRGFGRWGLPLCCLLQRDFVSFLVRIFMLSECLQIPPSGTPTDR